MTNTTTASRPLTRDNRPASDMFATHGVAARKMFCDAMTDVLSVMTFQHPFFASYLYDRTTIECLWPDDPLAGAIETAATSGSTTWFNAEYVTNLTAKQGLGLAAHEISHDMLDHPGRGKRAHDLGYVVSADGKQRRPYDGELHNRACDAEINAQLRACGFELPEGGVNVPWVKPNEHTVEDIYVRLYDEQQKKPPQGQQGGQQGGKPEKGQGNAGKGDKPASGPESGPGDGNGDIPGLQPDHGGFDRHVMPQQQPSDTDNADRKRALKAAVAMGKMAGNIPQNIERLVNDILEPVVDWEEVLKNMVVTRIGLDTLDWRKLNRRVFLVNGVINPARKSVRCGRIIFIVDVSGSTQEYVPQFVGGEIADVAESLQPKAIDVIWCDTRVAGVDTLEDAQAMDVGKLVVKGGGGTDLRPAFKHVQDELLDFGEEVACVIVLTDSETPWPDRDPGYPVIIATTAPKHPSNPKWAEIVEINEKQARRH